MYTFRDFQEHSLDRSLFHIKGNTNQASGLVKFSQLPVKTHCGLKISVTKTKSRTIV